RNDAIELTWLCDLLAPTAKCPSWAFSAHALFNHFAQKSPIVHEEARVNVFAQTWRPQIHSLPQSLQQITKAARKYNLNLEALSYASNTLDIHPRCCVEIIICTWCGFWEVGLEKHMGRYGEVWHRESSLCEAVLDGHTVSAVYSHHDNA
ncbi:hypothetical protein L208DRAFT_1540112, partial [Tricholoma matsutake]